MRQVHSSYRSCQRSSPLSTPPSTPSLRMEESVKGVVSVCVCVCEGSRGCAPASRGRGLCSSLSRWRALMRMTGAAVKSISQSREANGR